MTKQNQEPVVTLNDKEMKVSDLTPQQQYLHSQILDLNNQEARLKFQLDQVQASKRVFEQTFLDSTKEQADEVLNNSEENKNDSN
jgi:hypothetical protein|tara:strand:- start:510 stop:764 length:255 start_codon:yes stop_codon:yes gene_type:complete